MVWILSYIKTTLPFFTAYSHGDNVREILRKKKLAVVDGQDPEAFDAIQEEEGGSGQEDQGSYTSWKIRESDN